VQVNLHMYMYREINNKNTAQITTLGSSNHTLDALPTTWTWKKIAKLSYQALHLT